MSLLQKKYAALVNPEVFRTHRKPLLLATGAAVAAAPLLRYAYSCYQQWLALGQGGVPYNFLGWLAQSSMHLVARSDVRSPLPRSYKRLEDLAALYGEPGSRSYLPPGLFSTEEESGEGEGENKEIANLRPRAGDRPTVPSFVAPQRQTSDAGAPDTIAAQNAFLRALAGANPPLFELRTSGLEGPPHEALWLRLPSLPKSYSTAPPTDDQRRRRAALAELRTRLGRGSGGEFAHVHAEGSTHVTLSPRDAAALIAAGWAERHRLSGVGGARLGMVPWGYVLIYAPRNEEEFALWREVVLAGARYVADGAGVEVVVPE